jgi:hypothetical protein
VLCTVGAAAFVVAALRATVPQTAAEPVRS